MWQKLLKMRQLLCVATLLWTVVAAGQRRVEYDLQICDTLIGRTHGMSINGQIPAPTLEFTEGDTAVIRIHNHSVSSTSLHWHGVLVPNQFDGVPYLTSAPILPGESVTYEFPIVQNGTYWYHSHTGLQEQMGLYGAFVIHPRNRPAHRMAERVVLLSDRTRLNPMEVNRRLHMGSEWSKIQKGTVQSYGEAIAKGFFKTKIKNEWKRLGAMDVSDIYYDQFLANGALETVFDDLEPGSQVRLRIINGGAGTYFWLRYGGGKITVVASDGMDVEPVVVDRMLIAVSETYDIILTVPTHGSAELQATAEDRTGWTSIWIGPGMRYQIAPLPRLDYVAGMKMMPRMVRMNGDIDTHGMPMSLQKMDMNTVMYPELRGTTPAMGHAMQGMQNTGHHSVTPAAGHAMQGMQNMQGMPGMQGMGHHPVTDTIRHAGRASHASPASPAGHSGHAGHTMQGMGHSMATGQTTDKSAPVTLNYDMLRSPTSTVLPEGEWRELYFELNGNMNRFVWMVNGRTVSESDRILIREGENIRIFIHNNSMMRHPMHLHGHFFRLVNSHGTHSPLKFGLDILPGETDTIEFHAGERSRGHWYLHCHLLYHMMSGMGRIFSYVDSPANPAVYLPNVYSHDHMWGLAARNDLMTSGNRGRIEIANSRWTVQGEWSLGYKRNQEAEFRVGRYIGTMQWLMPFVGADWGRGRGVVATAGVRYVLPMLFTAEARIDHRGHFRLALERENIPITTRLRLDLMANTDLKYNVGLNYIIRPWFAVVGSWNSDLGLGLGLRFNY